MKFLVVVSLLLACAFANSIRARSPGTGRIVGGKEAAVGQFPFAAAVTVTSPSGRHFCGGTLVTAQFVLTSAFCVHGATHFDIILGAVDIKHPDASTVITLSTSDYITHPLFNPSLIRNDIALIKFHLPIQFTEYVQPIKTLAASVLPNSAIVYTYGWGQINDHEAGPIDKLHYVELTSLTNIECQHYYGNAITEEMVCVAGNNNEGTCHGDMGAPLIQYIGGDNAVHAGLASFISGNGCESTEPSGYTRTYHYRAWIQNITGV